jgi:outer membrane scaffolding protein for murein synthesis (MipA/OmpV family)
MTEPNPAGAKRWLRLFCCLNIVLCLACSRLAMAQTTQSPLLEWQYPGGTILERVYEPNLPDWRVVLGAAALTLPLYEGASRYRIEPGPVIDVRYKDIAFATIGEGIGYNFWRGEKSQAGISLGYDLGRKMSDDYRELRGLGDISAAPVVKIFGTMVVSKRFPLVLRADVRRIIGGADGTVGDVGFFMPLPGSSNKLVMFAGPSAMFADGRYERRGFGVSPGQSIASGLPVYFAHSGLESAGFGFSATRFLTDHWLVNTDMAAKRLFGSAGDSPITRARVQVIAELSSEYRW